jgi:hypothetical protein
MTAMHFASYSDARAHLKDLLDAADEGRPATVARDSRRVAVVQLEQLRTLLSAAVPAPMAVPENDGWSLIMPSLPIAADGSSLDEALDDLIVALREYAEDWNARLRLAPNHQGNWRLVQLVDLSDDDQLKAWIVGAEASRLQLQ